MCICYTRNTGQYCMSTKRRVLKTRENTQTLLSTLAEKEYCPAKNKYTANIYPKVTAFCPNWGGLRRGTSLKKFEVIPPIQTTLTPTSNSLAELLLALGAKPLTFLGFGGVYETP